MKDGPVWTFAELRQLLGVPEAIEFRYSAAMIDGKKGRLTRIDHLVALMPDGWKADAQNPERED